MEDEVTNLYNVLKEIFLLLDDGDRRVLSACNLTVPRFYALLHLGQNPGLSISELSALMFCDKSNVTRLVQNLEAENLVQRRRHKRDGRIICLSLTAQGEELRRDALARHHRYNHARFGALLQQEQQADLLLTLQGVCDGLQHELADNTDYPTGPDPKEVVQGA